MSLEKQLDKLDFGSQPVTPRLSASVLLARPSAGAGGFELLFVQRPGKDRFAGGQVVFPGGKVEQADYAATATEPEDAALPREHAGALRRAAARELYEEAGVLLAAAEVPPSFPPGHALQEQSSFYAALHEHGVRLAPERLAYWTNWVTPAPMPIRYDTYFFLALASADVATVPHPGEVGALHWFHPRAALAAFASGQIDMMYPTFKNLEQLVALEGLEQLDRFVRSFPKIRVEPQMRLLLDGGIDILLPEAWPAATPY